MEDQKAVNPTEPAPVDQAVQEPVEETTEQTATVEQETPQTAAATPQAVKQEGEVDEIGVPYKNRFYEYKRKYESLESNLPSMIQQAVREVIPQQTTQAPQYSEEQFVEYKNSTDDPKAKAWAEIELRRLDERKQEARFKSIIEERDKKMRTEQEQQESFNIVRQKYSVAFNQDGSPNINHPLTQRTIQIYNSDPDLQRKGNGLLIASDRAFADYALQQSPQLAQQQKQLKRQVKKLEKATLIEGGGQQQVSNAKSPLSLAKERLAQTGSEKDLKNVTKELLRARGMIQ